MFALIAAAPVLLSLPCPTFPPLGSGRVYQWETVDPHGEWDELVVSWNVKHAEGAVVKFEVRTVDDKGRQGPVRVMGLWTTDPAARRSFPGQRDEESQVLTDTLRLAKPGRRLAIQVYMETLSGRPVLDLVTLSFASREYIAVDHAEPSTWGALLDVAPRSQMSYPGGDTLCSPTSMSMLLRYWADRLHRPELDRDVPDVFAGSVDAGDPKEGNWPFTTAFAGSIEPFVSYVSRFRGISDLERWIAAGVPVACSVDYTLLQGKTGPKAGHLVVLIGFTDQGDPIFNDPGWSQDVRQVYRRSAFDRAWASSLRTVYLVYPRGYRTPPGAGPWLPSEPRR